jgi:DNA polymerase I-like protein with 3'-5' exonuclease and polymerase domains
MLSVFLHALTNVSQRGSRRAEWIDYCTYDAQATLDLYNALAAKLKNLDWMNGKSMFDFYEEHWKPFGELLTDMEREGVYIKHNTFFKEIEARAREDAKKWQDVSHYLISGPELSIPPDISVVGCKAMARCEIYEPVELQAEAAILLRPV